ncbi:MAG: hypothetical protein E7046_03440 [Lentisphaerae bacterium]|nr:hypothetical protein [Lentisphaerota bacterium]
MTTGKALKGKPYVGNPYVRFNEEDTASARRGSSLYKTRTQFLSVMNVRGVTFAILVATLVCGSTRASVFCTQNGATLTVRATSDEAGKGLVLLWDDTETSGVFANTNVVCDAVSSEGGSYDFDLATAGVPNGAVCRVATAVVYKRLDMLQMTGTRAYVDTGIKGKDVYGLRFGFYPTAKSGTGASDFYCAINCGKNNGTGTIANRGGFLVGVGSTQEITQFRFYWRGENHNSANDWADRVSTEQINEYAFTNGIATLNGTLMRTQLSGAICTNELNVFIGKTAYTAANIPYSLYGWWSHVSFDDADGNLLLDYVPVMRASDSVVGFWNRVGGGTFVPSSDTGTFGAGTPTGELVVAEVAEVADFTPDRALAVAVDDGVLTVTVPSGLVDERLIIAWDSADMGGDVADWANTAVIAESAAEGETTVRLGRLGVRNGQYFRVFAANAYLPLATVQAAKSRTYINTGIKDTEVFGVRFGFYHTGISAGYPPFIGTEDAKNKPGDWQVRVPASSATDTSGNEKKWAYRYRSTSTKQIGTLPSQSEINEAAFTNGVFTINGTIIANSLASGSVGLTGRTIFVGAANRMLSNGNTDTSGYAYGHWSHVSFDDADGNRILDYVPARRVASDGTPGTAGFYDRATATFVDSSGSGEFTAGETAGEEVVVCNSSSEATLVSDIPGLMIIIQ